ncbi:alpha/beta superfamily hydrolase [Cyanobium sp. PCC 7001]|uniref:DUF1350 family protein n=1 Tax=Cyanobium sp. PCC 7001 TaxID=180281 RepID=UPI00018049BD|nr:DUF1350 family protein [Cyanobium sp. PCC 7001]EDY38617.1 alpha/beta superfamily hydrolase [Cyanobium sp. PCC 7001]
MTGWRQRGEIWTLEPVETPRGLIEFIGGSYLAATPQLSYRRFLEALAGRGWRVHAWSYVPGFDHQAQANTAWRQFRQLRELEPVPVGAPRQHLLRLGHSLGCKLHLLAPDGGRRCDGLAALSFNNFSAERSIPFLAEIGQQLRFRSEFSPSPEQTLEQIAGSYLQPRNLLVRFSRDGIDQSGRLIGVLQGRAEDASTLLELPGDHLTPASGALRKQLLGEWADDPGRQRRMERLAEQISVWGSRQAD